MSRTKGFTAASESVSLAEACKLAWHTFYGMQKASEDFEHLRFHVWSLAISLDSVHSIGATGALFDRQAGRTRWKLTFSKMLSSTINALRHLYSLVQQYHNSSAVHRATVKKWLSGEISEGFTVRDFGKKLQMLVESLNVFLSCLTHAELARIKVTSETEQHQVLSEVTSSVLQKWRSDLIAQYRTETGITASPNRGLGISLPLIMSSQPRLNSLQGVDSSPSPWIKELDAIEEGFRKHLQAMQRIREQLQHQQVAANNQRLSLQSPAAPPPTSSTKDQGFTFVPLTPNSPYPTMKDGYEIHLDDPGDVADGSDAENIHPQRPSNNNSPALFGVLTSETHTEHSPGQIHEQQGNAKLVRRMHKRKRRSQYRFSTTTMFSSDDESDVGNEHQSPPKNALEKILASMLSFDQQ